MKIILIGPGCKEIPPKGWGAVESVVWDYYHNLRNKHDVEIINTSDQNEIIKLCNEKNADVVHIMYDDHIVVAPYLNCKKIFYTSHYAYITQPNFRENNVGYFHNIFLKVIEHQKLITINAISQEIADVYRKYGFNGTINVVRNGARDDVFEFVHNPLFPNKSVYVAKIEYRKRQYIYQSLPNLDFVGNYHNSPFDTKNPNYLGEWDKETLYKNLTDYGNLVLLSDGEADPLVVKEALMAGLGVVVSECSKANLDLKKDFISVIPNDRLDDLEYVNNIINKNREISVQKREEIREYALQVFSWSKIIGEYDNLLNSKLFNKVIIWGYPLHSHTHSYIHGGWFKAFQHLGYDTYWFHDNDFPQNFDYENCLFITEGYADKNIPLRKTSTYFVHICLDPPRYLSDVKRFVEIRYLVDGIKDCNYNYILDKEKCVKISDATYYEKLHDNGGLAKYHDNPIKMEYDCIYICWATDLLPHEIKEENIYKERENNIYWFGSYDKNNNIELAKFVNEAEKNNIKFIFNNPWVNPLSYEQVQEYTMKSILTPDIRSSGDPYKRSIGETGTCHKQIGYIPCRILKAISYGLLGITNSKRVYELLDKKVIYNDDESQLFYDGMRERNNFELIKEQMNIVREKHTYINRINDLLFTISL